MKKAQECWLDEELFLDSADFYQSILKDIAGVQDTLDVELYIFEFDRIGSEIAYALSAAAERGVRVRLLVDSVGSASSGDEIEAYFAGTKVDLRWYRRFFAAGWIPAPWRLNQRNHRKTWIFDKKISYVGSANVADCHLPVSLGGEGWKDASVRFVGHEMDVLNDAFELAWTKPSLLPGRGRHAKARKLGDDTEGCDNDLVHLNDTAKRRRALRKENRKRLLRAQKRVWLGNAYFAPHQRFVRALRKVAKKGVDVRVLVPRHSDVFIMPIITFSYYEFLLKGGVKLYEYLPTVYHAKVRLIDDHAVVGSSNLDYRSIFYNLEGDVCLTLESTQKKLEADFEADLAKSAPITLDTIRATPWWFRTLAHVLSILRYWV